jgi:Leucine-rich repeat (LRR) protein
LENLSIHSYPRGNYDFRNLNVSALSTAENVTIVGSNILKLPKNLINALPNVHNFVAENCGLEKLDLSLFGGTSATNLATVDLGGNQFPVLTDSLFAGAIHLHDLNLRECEIFSIQSQAFQGLGELEVLSLNFNRISVLDIVVWSPLKALTSLYLIGNQLLQLDFNVFQLNGLLRELEVGMNEISTLIAPKYEMKLTWLDLVQNHLTNIEALKPLKTLEFLLLSFNPTLSLPNGSFDSFSDNLKSLHLVFANLNHQSTTFSDLFGHLHKLQVLNIGKNAIGQLKIEELPKLPKLQFFHIFENGLETIEGLKYIKGKFPKLLKTDISQNNWNCTELNSILEELKAQNLTIDFVDDYPEKPRNGKVKGRLHNLDGVGCTHFEDYIFAKVDGLKAEIGDSRIVMTALANQHESCENKTSE